MHKSNDEEDSEVGDLDKKFEYFSNNTQNESKISDLLEKYLLDCNGIIHGLMKVPNATPHGIHEMRKALTAGILVVTP